MRARVRSCSCNLACPSDHIRITENWRAKCLNTTTRAINALKDLAKVECERCEPIDRAVKWAAQPAGAAAACRHPDAVIRIQHLISFADDFECGRGDGGDTEHRNCPHCRCAICAHIIRVRRSGNTMRTSTRVPYA